MPNKPYNQKLGDLLLKGKIIDDEQLAFALREHQVTGGKFGSIITRLNYSTEKNIIFFLYRKIFVTKKKRSINPRVETELGELLVRNHIITPKQLIEALKYQQSNDIKLGYALNECNIIDEKSLLDALSKQLFNTGKPFTGKGGVDEEIEDLTEPKANITSSLSVFALLLVIIIAVPVWYYFYTPASTPNALTTAEIAEIAKVKKPIFTEKPVKLAKVDKKIIVAKADIIKEPAKAIFKIKEQSPTRTEMASEVVKKQKKITKLLKPKMTKTDNKVFDTSFMNDAKKKPPVAIKKPQPVINKAKVAKIKTQPKAVVKKQIKIESIRYFSDGKIAKFVLDSKVNLKDYFKRTYLINQNMLFEFSNSNYKSISISNGHRDQLIENFKIRHTNKNNGFVMKYRMKSAGSSLYHVLKPNNKTPYYRLAITVRPKK